MKKRKKKEERNGGYLPECIIRTAIGMAWDSRVVSFHGEFGCIPLTGFKTLVLLSDIAILKNYANIFQSVESFS